MQNSNEIKTQIAHTTSLFKMDDDFNNEKWMRVRVAAMHSGLNRNNSYFSKECIEQAQETFKNIPVLADVKKYKNKDGSEYLDYSGHSMHTEQDFYNEDETRIVYDEAVVGLVPETNHFELVLDEETGNYYAYVDALLYREYGNYCCDVLEARNGMTDVSMEINCDDISFNAKDKYLEVGKMEAYAITLLGEHVQPGMAKAHAETFSLDKESREEQLIKVMQELTEALATYTKAVNAADNTEEGGTAMSKFEELLNLYNKTADDIEFDYEGMTDEELEAKFAELFTVAEADPEPENDPEETPSDENPEEGEDPEGEEEEVPENEEPEEAEPEQAPAEATDFQKTFSVSHEDIRTALYQLIAPMEELDGDWYWISAVYDDYFAYEGRNIYGQKYTVENDNVALDGERFALHRELLTDSEYALLSEMRANYATYADKVKKYEDEPKKVEILNRECYASIANVDEFQKLFSEEGHFNMSIEEVEAKADEILLSCAKTGKFSAPEVEEGKKNNKKFIPNAKLSKKEKRYGNLFDGIL